jgi:TrpR-related protein YerC/YecD
MKTNTDSYPTPEMKELFTAIRSIQSDTEASNFFRDLLTVAEIKEFANRWQMVKRLTAGESYLHIAHALNVSTTTVTRVAHWLREGMGGYKAIASRLFGEQKKP